MRHNALHAGEDPEIVRRLIRDHPWGTLVSYHDGRLAASHYPILLDDDHPELAVVTHVGRPDEKNHGFGETEMLLIVQGRHGYISPSWYAAGETQAPTWNFSAAHCYGVPQVLDPEENLRVLTRLVAHFEQHVDEPLYLDQEYGRRIARGTVGIRLPISRFVCKVKLSQDKTPETIDNVIAALRAPGPYQDPALADEMVREREAPTVIGRRRDD
jgi:transcriptional regulator